MERSIADRFFANRKAQLLPHELMQKNKEPEAAPEEEEEPEDIEWVVTIKGPADLSQYATALAYAKFYVNAPDEDTAMELAESMLKDEAANADWDIDYNYVDYGDLEHSGDWYYTEENAEIDEIEEN